jgi:hypothetical protein
LGAQGYAKERHRHDRSPFLDFGFLVGAEGFWRLSVARKNLLPEVGESLAHCRIGQGVYDGAIKRADDALWRTLGRPKRIET